MKTDHIIIRKASHIDLDRIKELADSETGTLGFVPRGAIKDGIELGYIFVAVHENDVVGFQQYYHRKSDYQTTLYRKTVAKQWRGKGIGTLLVDAVLEEAECLGRKRLFLKCPTDNPSNEFHKKYGFKLIKTEQGKIRKLNLYEYIIRK